MALNPMVYIDDIFATEQQYLVFLNRNLLNAYYLDQLKDFYVGKKEEILKDENAINNKFLSNTLNMINKMLNDIEELIELRKQGINVDVKQLSNSFLINQINNNVKDDVTVLSLNDDYLCDEFDEEVKPLKR
ncbi:MAG: hypothetical protein IJY25_06325 [Bacilli bacterium]|nr:hypothetical protein [Bacilli bacterium]